MGVLETFRGTITKTKAKPFASASLFSSIQANSVGLAREVMD
jgi:hypothetical protein